MEKITIEKSCKAKKAFIFNEIAINKFKNIFKRVAFQKNSMFFLFLFLFSFATVFAQLEVPFTPRLAGGNIRIKGDVVLIGNTILTANGQPLPFNQAGNNNNFNAVYLDVDGDNSTVSSSSANLAINNSCKRIAYAGLYWSAMYPNEVGSTTNNFNVGTAPRTDWNQVKFRVPGGVYVDVIADKTNPREVIFKGSNADIFNQGVYVCYKDVTSILQGLTNADGNYTVGNLRATRGVRKGGCAGGWTLVVIYESPTLPSKYISVFDGCGIVNTDAGTRLTDLDIPVNGFQTLPSPFPVNATIGISALDGDFSFTGDALQYKDPLSLSFTPLSTPPPASPPAPTGTPTLNPANNFFNASITQFGEQVTNRNPTSTNTLGYEIDHIRVSNPANSIITNSATSGTLKLFTDGDGFAAFVTTFAVDIIEPIILLTKEVKDVGGNLIGNADVNLGQTLNYEIGFQNQGNDDATNFTIKDILPVNTNFVYPTDILSVPTGVTHTYDAATRTILFTIPNSLVERNDSRQIIRFRIRVVDSCADISDACSNIIRNSAFATYRGILNANQITDDPSLSAFTACNLGVPESTNFLVGVDDCLFAKSEVLCGDSVVISAANGYSSYSWSSSATGSPVIGTNQTLTVTQPGTYYAVNTAPAPCLSIRETVTVTRFGGVINNPVIPFADEVATCPNNGKLLPKIFLCGQNDSQAINTNISDGSTITWERLNTASCTAVTNPNCANETTTCTWTQVATGPNYIADTAGEYRMTLNYPGNCFNRFYFNVFKNNLNPTETHRDIICTPAGAPRGNITIGGVGLGYEFSLYQFNSGSNSYVQVVNYQTSNSFSIADAGLYEVQIRQTGVTNPCIFRVSGIQIDRINFAAIPPLVTAPRCYNDRGSIQVYATPYNGAQYTYELFQGGVSVNRVGPIADSNYTFNNLLSGNYTFVVTTVDGCRYENFFTNIPASAGQIIATPSVIQPLTTCRDGIIRINTSQAQNFSNIFYYYVNGATTFLTSNSDGSIEFPAPNPGLYTIRVVGTNNCEVIVTQQVDRLPRPVYTVSTPAPLLCYSDRASITVNVTSSNGYIEYSNNNGATFQTSPTFSNLTVGTYNIVVRYKPLSTSPNTEYCQDTAITRVVAGPTTAVTASAGVAELAGCTLSGNGGKLRITNAEGGTAPYQYSFDGGTTWQASSEIDVLPGTYILKVRDFNLCEYTIPYNIILDPKPAEPTINVSSPDFNCNGTATSTVTVTNSASNYSYQYLLDGVLNTNTPSNVFTNVPSGPHTVRVNYNVNSVSTYSNLLLENFGYGDDTTSPGINTSFYCFERQVAATQCKGSTAIDDGDYSVTSFIVNPFGSWRQPGDHTPQTTPITPRGRSLVVNIGNQIAEQDILYQKQINDILPNQPILFELFVKNILNRNSNEADPDLRVALVDASGTEISFFVTGNIPKTELWEAYPKTPVTLNPGNNTTLNFIIRSNKRETQGNDVAIDDITVRQIPRSCIDFKEFPLVVDSNRAFTANVAGSNNVTCAGANDGTITIAAQNFNTTTGFQYSINGGTTWTTSLTSPITRTGLANATYDVRVRFNSAGECSLILAPVAITAPNPLTIMASVTAAPTCLTGATITASANGGTSPYQYELRQNDGVTVVRAFQLSGTFNNVAAGTYRVVARDNNNCVSPASATITITTPNNPSASLNPTSTICYTTTTGATLIVNATGTGTLSYSLDGQAAQNSNTFTNVGPGAHTIIVTDSNGCNAPAINVTIYNQLTSTSVVTKELDCTASPSGVITTTIVGGRSAFSYRVRLGSGAYGSSTAVVGTSFSYTAATAGVYTFEITDANGCQTTSQATINAISNPTVAATPTQVSCFGGTDGAVSLVGSGGSGGYVYSFNGSGFTATTNYSGLSAGVAYTYQVRDSKNCVSATGSITLTQPTQLVATASTTAFSCNASNVPQSATVTIAVPTTGTAPYLYSFNGATTFTATNTFTTNDNGTDQTVTYQVRDSRGCTTASQSIVINRLNPPTDLTFANAAVTCSATTTTVTATATNGVGALTYAITAPAASAASNTTGVFTGLLPNTYTFRVTDANGCYYTESHTVAAVTPIAIVGNKVSDVLCNAGTTGALRFEVSGNATVGNYTYSLTPNNGSVTKTGNTLNVSGLTAASYTMLVTDTATGCTASQTIVVNQPAVLGLTAVATNVYCTNDVSRITVTPSGGTPNYTYAAVVSGAAAPLTAAYGSNPVLVDTNSGATLVWDVYVKDANNCTRMRTITVVSDPIPSVTAVISNQCTASGSGFTLTATGTGGTGTLTYGINGSTGAFQSANTFNVAPSATPYTVWVKDANGCTASATPITVYNQLTSISVVTKELDCTASPSGVITTTIVGGRSAFSYRVRLGSGAYGSSTAVVGTSFSYTAATAGVYTFEITDANGCQTTSQAIINAISNPTVVATPTQVSCFGGTDGAVSLVGSGGSGGYVYSFNGSGLTATTNYPGLSAGVAYTYQVRDSKNCISATGSITLTQPTQLVASASATAFSCDASNAKQSATVTIVVPTTGTAPYLYSFNGATTFTATNTLTINDNGTDQTVTYQVRDSRGCTTAIQSIVINRLNPPTDLTFANAAVTCSATTTTVTATATNGVGALTYAITAPAASAASNTTGVFAGLLPNIYTFRVTDTRGCFYTETYTVNPVTPIAVTATKLSDVDCFGSSTGSIRYNVSGFGTTYSYTINGGTPITAQTAPVVTLPSLSANTYNVVFIDDVTACSATTSIVISQPAAALSATVAQINANCFSTTSRITVTASGGTPSYTYAFKQNGVAPVLADYNVSNIADLNPTTNLNWDAWVKDANGCAFKIDVTLITDSAPTVTASATGQCLGVGSYTITANGTGGTGALGYSINGGASYQPGNTFVVTTSGNYTITVRDSNNCTATSNVINVAAQLTLSAVLNKDITCSTPAAAQITLTPAGGVGPFTYTASPNTGSFAGNVFTTTTANSYIFTVTDATTLCTYTTTSAIVTTTPVNPDITGVTQTAFINCNGDDTAAISITINNTLGQSPFVFNVFNNTTSTNYGTQTSGLSAGIYTITLTDAKGCIDTQNITINEPTLIIVSHSTLPITCNSSGVSKGSIFVDSVTGGTAPYNYFVTGVNGYNASELNATGSTSITFDVVDFGLYQINVVDANGCTIAIQNVLVASPPNDLDISVVPVGPTCVGLGSAEISIGALSSITGAGPFHFAVYSPGLTYTGPTSPPWYDEDAVGSKKTTIPNLLPGVTYTFIVHDALTGCYYYETSTIAIPTNSTITVAPLAANNITCRGAADGSVTFTMNHTYGSATPVTYQIYNSQSVTAVGSSVATTIPASGSLVVNNFGALPFGNYFVLVTEDIGATNAGCSISSASFNITESAIDLAITAQKIKKINCNEDGIIAAFASNGTGPYTYQYLLDTVTAPSSVTSGWVTNTTFATSVLGDYIVYVKDAYGCIKFATITLDADAPPVVTAPVAPICYDGNPFTITFSGTVDPAIVGAPTYSVNSSAFQNLPIFTFNAAGTYNLVIRDGNGCIDDVDYIVYPQLQLTPTLTKVLDCSSSPNATISLATIGGNTIPLANYTYEVNYNSGGFVSASNPYSAANAGSYLFRVTDANNTTLCQATATIVLDPIAPTVFTTTQTDVSCFGGNDGTISVNVTSGVGPYQYRLDSGTFQNSNVFTGLSAGTSYVITVRNAILCLNSSLPITISQQVALSAVSTITTPLSCGIGNAPQPATVTINGSGGTSPYQYSYDGGTNYSTTNTYQSYVGTTFNVLVKDAKGCIFTLINGVNIPALVPPTDLTFSTTTAVTCLAPATVEITGHTGGIGTLQYETIASSPIIIPKQLGTIFSGLIAGDYVFQVTDANSCTYLESYTVNPVTNITVSGQLVSNVLCNGDSTGSVRFTAGNFAGMYRYTINGGTAVTGQSAATINLTGLSTGPQVIVVTDEVTGCTASETINVIEPAALTLVELSNVNANCNIGARVTVAASGGTPGYTYAFIADGATPALADYTPSASAILAFTAPGPNNYDVWVKDTNGCTRMLDVSINTDASPTIALPASQCYIGNSFIIDLSVGQTVAVTPASYKINGSTQSSPIYTVTGSGTYILSIIDGNGCESASVNYVVRPQLTLAATLTKDLDCTASPNGTISLAASGGTLSYTTYEVSINGGSYVTIPGTSYAVTTAGDYRFRVTDSQLCQAESNTITILPLLTPSITPIATDVSCIGSSDGTIRVTGTSGTAPYSYTLTGAGANTTGNANGIYTGLPAGTTYVVTVTDAKSCSFSTGAITIGSPVAITASISVTTPLSCGTNNAANAAIVTVTASGGTGSLEYSFDGINYSSDFTYETTTSGPVTASVRDANGCLFTGTLTTTVVPLAPPSITGISSTAILCSPMASTTSTATISTSNGVGSLSFAILEPVSAVGNTTGASSGVFSGLAADSYLFEVTDANGCKDTERLIIAPVTNITVSGQLVSNVLCNGGSTGSVRFAVGNFAGTYSYTINGGAAVTGQSAAVINVTGLGIGNQVIVVTDEVTGCTATATILVSEPTALALTQASNVNANCNIGAQVSVSATGGTPGYTYAFVADGATPALADYTASASATLAFTSPGPNNYDAWVKDANGCTDIVDISINIDPLPSGITISGLSQCPDVNGDYSFTVNVASGIAPYEYSIGSGFQTSPNFTVNSSGNYNVTVKDGNGCEITVASLVSILPPLEIQSTITALPSCSVNDGSINVSVTGGSGVGNYSFQIDGGTAIVANTTSFGGLSPGLHTILVTDLVTNCTVSVILTLEAATPITGFSLSKTDVTCNAGTNGSITATLAPNAVGVNDNPIYTYSLSGTTITSVAVTRAAQTENVFDNLAAGTYTVTVTSGRLCEDTATITIVEPAEIVVATPTVTQFGCTSNNTANFATINIVTVSGGSGNYTKYDFYNNGTLVQSGTSSLYTEANFAGGTNYSVIVYDDKGCQGATTAAIVINPYINLNTINTIVNAAITCTSDEEISVSASSTGGTPSLLNYSMDGAGTTVYNQANTTGIFTGLFVGQYLITVQNPATGCSIQKAYFVNDPNTFSISANKTSDVICLGSNDGAVTLTFVDNQPNPTNEAGIFDYVVTGPTPSSGRSTGITQAISGLLAGQYTVSATLVGNPFCSVETSFTIDAPSAALSIQNTFTDITCDPSNNGTITATATGGWSGNYEFQLELGAVVITPWSTSPDFSNLGAGTYTVKVRDSKGCEDQVDQILTDPVQISATITASTTMLNCDGDDNASITVTSVTGGQGSGYLYTLNYLSTTPLVSSGPQSNPLFSGLGQGTYSVTVTDGWGCSSDSNSITINEPTEVISELKLLRSLTCDVPAQVTLEASGGTGPYRYSNDGINFSATTFASTVSFDVPVGDYQYYVIDANNCNALISNEVAVEAIVPLTIILDIQNAEVKCKDEPTGVIVAEAEGGFGNYVYTLLDNANNPITPAPIQLTPGVFTELAGGFYRIRVDSNDCDYTSAVVEITEPATALTVQAPAVVNITCFGERNGSVTITASGGTGLLQYAISPNLDQFFDTNIFENLVPGTYEIIVQDANGCYEVISNIVLTEPVALLGTLVPGSILPEICVDDNDAAFSITVQGGTAPYSVSLDDRNGVYTPGVLGQTQFDFVGLTGGDHTVYIRDANGCPSSILVETPEPVLIDPKADVDFGCDNNSPSNTVTVIVDESITDLSLVSYSLDGSGTYQASNVFRNLAPGDHFVSALHTNGCEKLTLTFNIPQLDPLEVILSDGELNEIVATATGGTGVYTYSFEGESSTTNNKYIYYKSGVYTVVVTDSNGCTATFSRYFEFIDIEVPNIFTPNNDGTNDTWKPEKTRNYPDAVFSIFDRYGRKVATLREGEGWDGKYNDADLPTGDYWYKLDLNNPKDDREFVGHFTLYR